MFDIVKTRAEFDRLHTEAGDYLNTIADRAPTEDEANQQRARFARMETLKAQIEDAERLAGLQFSKAQAGEQQPGVTLPEKSAAQQAVEGAVEDADTDPFEKADRRKFARSLSLWAATGLMAAQFATITTATASGVLLPKQVAAPIVNTTMNVFREALEYYGQKPIKTSTTADLVVPVLDGAAGGEVAEDASSETENAPTFAEKISLKPKTYQSGSAWYSNMVLNANDFDLETQLLPQLAANKELGLEKAIIDYMIADSGITQVVTTATTTGFTYANLVDLNRKLPKRWDRLKVILLSNSAYAAAEKMVGDDGHPVLVKDPQNQELLKFNGTLVLRCDYLEALTANKTVGIIFSLLGFRLRDVNGGKLHRYTQTPGKVDQTGFNLVAYHGWGYAVSAVAKFKTAAS